MSIKSLRVFEEVSKAYADCGKEIQNYHETLDIRNLRFRASQSVSPEIAVEIMKLACPGYNDFEAEDLAKFPDDCQITIAREGSVCVYVKPGEKKLPTRAKLGADEYDIVTEDNYGIGYHAATEDETAYGGFKGEIRVWWD